MAGIKHLSEIYKKQGASFLDELFSKELTVSEKLNGMSFSFEKSIVDGSVSFYKRDQDNPISKIDRVLMKYYESPISHIQNLSELALDEIPSGWRFGMEFFINPSPVLLSYQRIPRNGLVLTHIIAKNSFGDIEKTIVEKEELDYWADLIDVEVPPIIFQGKLDDQQKVAINDFINSDYDSLKQKYGSYSFAKYLVSVLNPSLSKTALNDSLDEPIEGVVFRFGSIDGSGESFTAKILDPVFEDITRQNNIKKASYFPSDIYGITILEVMNFVLDKGVSHFTYEGEDPHDRYISYICSIFNEFVKNNGEKYLGLDFQEPDFFKKEGFETNLALVSNDVTKGLIAEDESYESLFKLILSAFRKIKKKSGGFFTQGAIEQFNILVREISQYLNEEIAVTESIIPTFDQFRKKKPQAVFIPQEEDDEEEDSEEDKEERKEDKKIAKKVKELEAEMEETPIETPSEEELVEEPEIEDDTELGEEPDEDVINKIKDILGQGEISIRDDAPDKGLNIVIGKFQPFNNGHLRMIKKANQQNDKQVAVFVVKSGKNCFMEEDILKKMMNSVASELSDAIHSVHYVDDDLLSTSLDQLGRDYNPTSLTIGKPKLDNYVLQSKSLKKRKKLPTEFQVQSAPSWVNSEEVRKTLYDKNYTEFRKNVPKSVSVMWEELLRNYHSEK
jgi:cytidyltransferase-like protein